MMENNFDDVEESAETDIAREKNELDNLLRIHGVVIKRDSQVFAILYEMATTNQLFRMAYDESTNDSYYEWSPMGIALMRPFMQIGETLS